MPINNALHRLWLVCCLCVVCAQAQAWQSGDTIAIVANGNGLYLTANATGTAVETTTTPTDAALWVVTNTRQKNYTLKNVRFGTYLGVDVFSVFGYVISV